ncbi:MAG: ribonuclease HII [Muriicola sp.]|nr:ribonuclease HII [Muriicola sp.]
MALLREFHRFLYEAGTDEAGRGCLAGPVTAAAVILPPGYFSEILNDSKVLSEKQRSVIGAEILSDALSYSIVHIDPATVDEINVLNASILGMHKALSGLSVEPRHILVDGNQFKPFEKYSHECIVKGDGKYMSIAAASVLAKNSRDEYMRKLHKEYPVYNWQQNKGYPTLEHRKAILKYGLTPYHRKSFKIKNDQLSLEL